MLHVHVNLKIALAEHLARQQGYREALGTGYKENDLVYRFIKTFTIELICR